MAEWAQILETIGATHYAQYMHSLGNVPANSPEVANWPPPLRPSIVDEQNPGDKDRADGNAPSDEHPTSSTLADSACRSGISDTGTDSDDDQFFDVPEETG